MARVDLPFPLDMAVSSHARNVGSETLDFLTTRNRMQWARENGLTYAHAVMFDIDAEGIETGEFRIIQTDEPL